jgi:hypothetical protein
MIAKGSQSFQEQEELNVLGKLLLRAMIGGFARLKQPFSNLVDLLSVKISLSPHIMDNALSVLAISDILSMSWSLVLLKEGLVCCEAGSVTPPLA